jgi:hypothetical protein
VLHGGDEGEPETAAVDRGSLRLAQVQQRVGKRLKPGDLPAVNERSARVALGDEPVRTGCITSRSVAFTLFLNVDATQLLACGGVKREAPKEP